MNWVVHKSIFEKNNIKTFIGPKFFNNNNNFIIVKLVLILSDAEQSLFKITLNIWHFFPYIRNFNIFTSSFIHKNMINLDFWKGDHKYPYPNLFMLFLKIYPFCYQIPTHITSKKMYFLYFLNLFPIYICMHFYLQYKRVYKFAECLLMYKNRTLILYKYIHGRAFEYK